MEQLGYPFERREGMLIASTERIHEVKPRHFGERYTVTNGFSR